MRLLTIALLSAALAACGSSRSTTSDTSARQGDAGVAPAENTMTPGSGTTGAETTDADANMPNESNTDRDAEYELEPSDVDAPAMDEDAVTEGDYVEQVLEANPEGDAKTVRETRADYGDVSARGTLDAVESAGGLTALPVDDAVATIDRWIVKVETGAAAPQVGEKLRALRGLLTAATIDGPAVGQTLVELGEMTSTAAGTSNAELTQLATALSQAGQKLSDQ